MDIDMPIMDGIKATQEILGILGKANILVSIVGLSAFDQEQIKDKAIRVGMKEYVTAIRVGIKEYVTKPIPLKKWMKFLQNTSKNFLKSEVFNFF